MFFRVPQAAVMLHADSHRGAEAPRPTTTAVPLVKGVHAEVGAVMHFFKQKTAYEIMSGDWSSDVCSSD
eukprot:COSAG01_NODE_58626_length_305_cov_0.519417_1_plen_68_part_01